MYNMKWLIPSLGDIFASYRDKFIRDRVRDRVMDVVKKCDSSEELKKVVSNRHDISDLTTGESYIRTPVFMSKEFDVYFIHWPPLSRSPIHDHPETGCWMKVVSGNVRETLYPNLEKVSMEIGDSIGSDSKTLTSGDTTYIRSNVNLHSIHNPSPTHTARTLHVYSPGGFSTNIYQTLSEKF